MANEYDFFGQQSGVLGQQSGVLGQQSGVLGQQSGVATPVGGGQPPTPAVDRWGMPLAAPPQAPSAPVLPTGYVPQPANVPAAKGRHLQAAIGIVVAGAVAASAYFFLTRPHPVSLPATAGGLAAVTDLSASQKSDIKDMEKQLGKDNVHDIATRVYGDLDSGQGLIVVAGHINKADADMQQVSSQIASAAAGVGTNLSSGTVSSGGTQFQCLWASASGHTMSVCFWWSNHSVLMGVGVDFDAQAASDALAQVKAYGSLK